jgi:GNAT superfamily N-acetyltransferase
MLTIRPLSMDQIDDFVTVTRDAAQWALDRGHPAWALDSLTRERFLREGAPEQHHVAYWHDRPVGAVILTFHDPRFWPDLPSGTSGFIHKLSVIRSYHGTGLAELLLTYVRLCCRQHGVQDLRLDCDADRLRLRAFYERNGFSSVGQRIVYQGYEAAFYHQALHPPVFNEQSGFGLAGPIGPATRQPDSRSAPRWASS